MSLGSYIRQKSKKLNVNNLIVYSNYLPYQIVIDVIANRARLDVAISLFEILIFIRMTISVFLDFHLRGDAPSRRPW